MSEDQPPIVSAPRTSVAPHASRRLPQPLRLFRHHARLFLSIAAGGITFVVARNLPTESMLATKLLVAWDVGVVLYLALVFALFSRFDLTVVRQRAAMYDEGGLTILILTVAAAVASLGAIVAELGAVTTHASRGPYFALAVVTILLSWTFIHAIFTLHYAYVYYGERADCGGLVFPDDDRPDYWDFVYFAFVIGMTFQVSDVQITSKELRRAVVAHGTVAFLFNVAILALVVNLGAALFQAATPTG